MRSWITLAWWLSKGYRGQLLRAALGAFFAVALTVGLCSLGESARSAVNDELLGGGDVIRARPPSFGVGPVDLAGTLFPTRRLDTDSLRELEELEGIQETWPEAWSRFPVTFRGEIGGQSLYTEGALLGVEPDAVEDRPEDWSWAPGERVPLLVPKALVVAFNRGFAPANGLPRLTDSAVEGLRFRIHARRPGERRTTRIDAEVAGVTRYGGVLAGMVPIEVVHWLDEELEMEDPGTYSSALLLVTPGHATAEVEAQVRDQGWGVEEVGGAARQIAVALRAVDIGVGIAGGILALAALMLLAQIYGVLLRERGPDLRILRSLGAPRSRIALALATEVATASLLAAVLGAAAGVGLSLAGGSVASAGLGEMLGVEITLSGSPPEALLLLMTLGAPLVVLLASAPAIVGALSGSVLRD